MPAPKIFATREHIIPEAIARLSRVYDVEVWREDAPPPKSLLAAKAADCDALVTEITDIVDAEVLDSAARLKVVSNRAVGVDNIDIAAATRNGVLVGNTPGTLHESCADFTMGLILSLARNIAYGDRRIRGGHWTMFDQIPYVGTDVHGATLGIVGMGLIGAAVARRAAAFDMRVIYHSRTRKPDAEASLGVQWRDSVDAVLREADFVSLHVPLTPQTEFMIGERELGLMQRHAYLINTTRGRTVDPAALHAALAGGAIAGAALDVTEPEPLPPDDPLLALDNIVFTPHIASASRQTLLRMGDMVADNVAAALNGAPMPSCVNPDAALR